ncbi:MAG: MFS transporter [Candidatus Heimdallarchaeota archaeon]
MKKEPKTPIEENIEEAFQEEDGAPKLLSFEEEEEGKIGEFFEEDKIEKLKEETGKGQPLLVEEEEVSERKSWLALFSPSMISLLLVVILVGMGEKMAERFLPLYLVALGGGALTVSLLNGMDNLLSALYSFPGGFISDLIGYKQALIVFNIMAMVGYAIVIAIAKWWAVIIGAFFFISWTAISLPAVMSMIAHVIPKKKHTMGVTFHSLVRRLPMALGPIFGGLLITNLGINKGIRIAFSIAIVLAAIATVLQWFMAKEPAKKKEPVKLLRSIRNIPGALWHLLVSDILIRFAEQIPYAFVVIYVVTMNGLTEVQFGILTTIEMVTAILIYIPVAYFADKYRKKPFVLTTFIFFTAFPFFLLLCNNFWLFAIAFIIRGLKEFGEPTRKTLILELAPPEAKANTFGAYYLLRDIVVSLAAFGAGFLWKITNVGPQVTFIVAGAFGVIGVIYFAIFGKDIKSLEKARKLTAK